MVGGLALWSVGCGDDATPSSGSGSAESTSSQDDGTQSDAGATSATGDGGTGTAGGGSGSGSGSDGSAGGACEPDGDLLFPLEVGRVWDFDLGCVCECDPVGWVMTVTGTETIGGREAFVTTEGCGFAEGISYLSVDGQTVERWNEFSREWEIVIEGPVVDGQVWSDGVTTWIERGEVTVPAGTFSDCWEAARGDMFGSHTIYCAGIGPVSVQGFELEQQLRDCR